VNGGDPWPILVDGRPVDSGAPAVAADDEGFLLGLAVFDTLAVDGGRVPFLDEHLARLVEGAQALGIAPPEPAVLRAAVATIVARLGGRDAALRLTLTPGAPGRGARGGGPPRPAPSPEGVAVLVLERAKLAGQPLEAIKSTSRARNVLARRAALARGAHDALLATDEGDLSEGTVANLFLVLDGELRTPPLDRGVLAGVTRGKLLELAREAGIPTREARVERADLARCEEAFLSSTLVRVLPITRVLDLRDDLPAGGGPLTRELARRLREAERAS
jgi:branched-subunit amino acid aminotransferase/4-amino-4-deoxychorismate lyase